MPPLTRRRLLAAAALAAASPPARAQSPARPPIRILVGFAPGGSADLIARIAADAVRRRTGIQAIVEIRSGAAGYLATQAVARAAADGLTVAIVSMAMMTITPQVPGSPMPHDIDADLLPICNLACTPVALIVRPDAPFRSLSQLVAHGRANPGALSFASAGNGSMNHLAGQLFAGHAGLKMLHVPYRGGMPAALDVAGGRVDMMFANVSEVGGLLRGGQVRGLALAAAQPSSLVAGLPPMAHEYPGLDMQNWFGLVGPAGLAPAEAAEVARLFTDAIADPATGPALATGGLEALPELGADFQAHIRRDRERWKRVVVAGNIRVD